MRTLSFFALVAGIAGLGYVLVTNFDKELNELIAAVEAHLEKANDN